ncbi:MAG: TraU family protein [Nitrospinae bacterium]|nr:TraU family protein [Nitrospinota bacterium]
MGKIKAFLIAAAIMLAPGRAWGACAGTFFNPLVDVAWECMLPIKIAGVPVVVGQNPAEDAPDLTSTPFCACMYGVPPKPFPGLPVSYWEPARIIETVKDPFCFPTLGLGLSNPFGPGMLAGSHARVSGSDVSQHTFAQAHIFSFPLKELLGSILLGSCATTNSDLAKGFGVTTVTEVDPLWNNGILAAFTHPESFLFANPVAAFTCIADSVTANLGMPLDPLFWCVGSWGIVYPLTGDAFSGDQLSANAELAVRSWYRLGKVGMLWDAAIDPTLCLTLPTPVWIKSHYKLQIMKPVPGRQCIPIGRSSLIWGAGKNVPFTGMSDQFSWVLFRKKACCAW